MSANPPPSNETAEAYPMNDEEKLKEEQWQQFEAQLKAVQSALQEPMMDTFVRSSEPERTLSVLDMKTPV